MTLSFQVDMKTGQRAGVFEQISPYPPLTMVIIENQWKSFDKTVRQQ
jgi:hypothetical protein